MARGGVYLLFRKKELRSESNDVIETKVESILSYMYIYSGYYYSKLSNQYPDFKKIADDYSFAFMELYTIAGLSVAVQSPVISKLNIYDDIISALEKHIKIYFANSENDLYGTLESALNFQSKHTVELIELGYNYSDVAAYWLLHNMNVFKDGNFDYDLLNDIGNELTNHFIFIFDDTWKPREIDPNELLSNYKS